MPSMRRRERPVPTGRLTPDVNSSDWQRRLALPIDFICYTSLHKAGWSYRHKNREQITPLPVSVPEAGVEPARIAPTVFETVASTDSAIRADGRRKGSYCLLHGQESWQFLSFFISPDPIKIVKIKVCMIYFCKFVVRTYAL